RPDRTTTANAPSELRRLTGPGDSGHVPRGSPEPARSSATTARRRAAATSSRSSVTIGSSCIAGDLQLRPHGSQPTAHALAHHAGRALQRVGDLLVGPAIHHAGAHRVALLG